MKIGWLASMAGVIIVVILTSLATAGGHPENARYDLYHNFFYFLVISDTHIGQETKAERNLENLLGHTKNIIRPDFMVNAGDLTDQVPDLFWRKGEAIPRGPDQWFRYRAIVRDAGMTNKIYSEVPGNHDNYMEADDDDPLYYYRILSTQGLATKGETQRQWWPKKGYQFVMIDTVNHQINHYLEDWDTDLDPVCNPNVFDSRCQPAEIDDDEITEIQQWLQADSNLIFVVGHHGVNNVLPIERRNEFLDLFRDYKVSAYLYGHTHQQGAWMLDGTLHLNVDSLYEHDSYALVAIDNDGISFVRAALNQWPIVLITAPLDKKLGGNNPYAYSVPSSQNNPIRALVFNDPEYCSISSVKMFVKKQGASEWEEIGDMGRASNDPKNKLFNLWEGFWDSSRAIAGDYQIGVWAECILPSQYFPPPVSIQGNSITVVVAEPANHEPVAGLSMTAKGQTAYENQTLNLTAGAKEKIKISFSGSRSADLDQGDLVQSYQWYLNGKEAGKKKDFSKTLSAGIYAVYLKVKDSKGAQGAVGASIIIASDRNIPPDPPTLLSQLKKDGITPIPAGGETNENAVLLKGSVTDPDANLVKLQIELRQMPEGFSDVPNYESDFMNIGSTASIIVSNLANGDYQWRARTVDQQGGASAWVEAGNNNKDFTVRLSSNLAPSISSFTAEPTQILINGTSIISVSASDPEGDPLTYSWSANGGSLSASDGHGPITWTAPNSHGIFEITVSVQDNKPWHAPVSRAIEITVVKPNIGIISLPRTGQIICHDEFGHIIDCAGTGQDGEIQAGVPWPDPRFTNLDGTTPVSEGEVLDRLTGLVWMRDAGTPTLGPCKGGRQTWEEALNYVACLNSISHLGHNDWRLPNINELESLVNAEKADSTEWLNNQGFLNVRSYVYFSSTPEEIDAESILAISWDGTIGGSIKPFDMFVWPVRSGQSNNPDPLYPANIWKTGKKTSYAPGDDGDLQIGVAWPLDRFTDHGDLTVTDNLTGLMWPKKTDTAEGVKTWPEALAFVKSLNSGPGLAGYHDWRLPNKKEILSLIDRSIISSWPIIDRPFQVTHGWYWTSTAKIGLCSSDNCAWCVTTGGAVYFFNKFTLLSVWPVRAGK